MGIVTNFKMLGILSSSARLTLLTLRTEEKEPGRIDFGREESQVLMRVQKPF